MAGSGALANRSGSAFYPGDADAFNKISLEQKEYENDRHRHEHVAGHNERGITALVQVHAEQTEAEREA